MMNTGMSIQFTLPAEIERALRDQVGDLNQVAKESALVELYRQGKLTRPALSDALGLSRLETDRVLKLHNVTEDLMTVEEFDEQLRRLERDAER
jgi:hypothetical protein